MNKKLISTLLVYCFCAVNADLSSQVKYWVRLKDKTGTPYTISNPSGFLTQKSIQRRTTYNIPVDASDLPVNPSYISQIENVPDVTVVYASKWLNGLVVSIPDKTLAIAALSTVNSFSFVVDTSRVKKYHLNIPDPVRPTKDENISYLKGTGTSSSYNYGGSYWQNKQMNLIELHEQGYRGQGMTIAVMDAGFYNVDTHPVFDSLRNSGGILGTYNFAAGGTNVYTGSIHGTMVLSCMAANKPGRILGSAPLAKYWLFRTEEAQETISEEYNWIRAAEFADSVGVDILTTSLGYTTFDPENASNNHTYATLTGRKAPMSIASTMAARKGMFVLNAAGNEGASSFHYISVPGDADSICTVGAVDSLENVAVFSSVGPTYDGRVKPEFATRGAGSWVSDGVFDGFPGNGTSFATPILAGAVACFWQAHKEYNNIKVLDTLKKGANNHCKPNNSKGWGMPKMVPDPITIRSKAFLNGKTSHNGIKIKFIAASSSARTDSTLTNTDGTYSVNLYPGAYKVIFSKLYYQNVFYHDTAKVKIDLCMSQPEFITLLLEPSAPEMVFDFTAYADASKDEMTIVLSEAGYDYVTIEVYDLAGKILLKGEPEATLSTIKFDISNLADEIYLVKVKTSKGTKTKKVLKRK